MFLVLFGGNFFINKEAHGTLPLAVGFESCIETGRIHPGNRKGATSRKAMDK